MKRRVIAADEGVDSGLEDAMGTLEADFEYALSGLEKLGRSGVNASNDALAIVENMSNDLKKYIAEIADKVAE